MTDQEHKTADTSPSVVYPIVSQHWAHAEQVRWTLLYNFLMASTILLLAWATIFAGSSSPRVKTAVLFLLCVAGFLLSVVWVALGQRGSSFVRMYAELGRRLEPDCQQTILTPFRRADQHRTEIIGIGRWALTYRVLVFVPGIFAALYAVLSVLSFFA
jgi:hypothetical protein